MAKLNNKVIRRLRRAVSKLGFLPDTARIQRLTLTADASGGNSEAWTTITTVKCRLSPATPMFGKEGRTAEQVIGVVEWQFIFPAATDCQAADRIFINGKIYQVKAVASGRTHEVLLRVLAARLSDIQDDDWVLTQDDALLFTQDGFSIALE